MLFYIKAFEFNFFKSAFMYVEKNKILTLDKWNQNQICFHRVLVEHCP